MNSSTLKILVPLGILMGVIFAVTVFTQNTPNAVEERTVDRVSPLANPLRFFTSSRQWIPYEGSPEYFTGSLQNREFPGYFEPGETEYPASFWFENRNNAPVTMQLLKVSCTSCSGGQVAPIPPDLSKQILQMTAISLLPQGFATALPAVGLAGPAAQMDSARGTLVWQKHAFNKPIAEIVYTVPAAPTGDPWYESWNILQLYFKVRPGAFRPLEADFRTQLQGTERVAVETIKIIYQAAAAFDLDPQSIDIGELTDASSPQNHEFIIYSSTRRKMSDLSLLVSMPPGVSGEPGEFIAAGKPIPIPENQLPSLAVYITVKKNPSPERRGPPVRVESAIRVPVTVSVKVGQNKLDIGRVERVISVTQGSETKQVVVHGSMRGPIFLANGATELSFGTFKYTAEHAASVIVETERSGVELSIVKELTQPKCLKIDLRKQTDNGERGSYKLRAVIPASEQLGEIRDGVVVLEAKGPNPQRMRIPVTGRGRD
jgi:hypothetical protein